MFLHFRSLNLEILLLDVPLIRRGTAVVVLHMSPEKRLRACLSVSSWGKDGTLLFAGDELLMTVRT